MISRFLLPIMLPIALAGCGNGPPIQSSSRLQLTSDTMMPAPLRADLVAPDRASLIGPLDTVSVDVFGIPDLSREVQVDASGRIAYPLVGVVDVKGRTAEEVSILLAGRLRGQYVRNPQVTVNLKGSVSQVVTVDGEVTEPGLYPVSNQMTLMRAIASAKGLSEFAKINEVVILRDVGGKHMAGLYNLGAIRRGVYDDPLVYANDVVVVGDSPSRRLFKNVLSVAPLLVAPAVALIQRR